MSRADVIAAEKAANEKIGFAFTSEVAVDYEDSALSTEQIEALRKAGVKVEFSDDDFDEDGNVSLGVESYFNVWSEIVKLGNPAGPIES